MSVYTPTEWINDNPPAINATNLNHMEKGISDAHIEIEEKMIRTDYATATLGGTIKARLDGTDLYLSTDGSNP